MRLIGVLLLSVLLTACASSPASPAPTTEPVPTSQPVAIATDMPKQPELIFVEFFAVT